MGDIRDIIFKDIYSKRFKAVLTPERSGCLSGVDYAIKLAEDLEVEMELYYSEGNFIECEKPIGSIISTPKKMALAEEKIIGALSKFSGIATAAKKAVDLADGKFEIVSGSWKKMPPSLKDEIRAAIISGGANYRISNNNMIYLDKNYIKMLGSITNALNSVKDFKNHTKVIQIKGKDMPIEEETKLALENECNILMVDNGNLEDLIKCSDIVNYLGYRNKVEIAFAGGVKIDNIKQMYNCDIDKLCIGKEIVDAQLLDIRLDVTN